MICSSLAIPLLISRSRGFSTSKTKSGRAHVSSSRVQIRHFDWLKGICKQFCPPLSFFCCAHSDLFHNDWSWISQVIIVIVIVIIETKGYTSHTLLLSLSLISLRLDIIPRNSKVGVMNDAKPVTELVPALHPWHSFTLAALLPPPHTFQRAFVSTFHLPLRNGQPHERLTHFNSH